MITTEQIDHLLEQTARVSPHGEATQLEKRLAAALKAAVETLQVYPIEDNYNTTNGRLNPANIEFDGDAVALSALARIEKELLP